MKTKQRSKRSKAPLYKAGIILLVGAYIILYALSLFKSPGEEKLVTKENKMFVIGDYEIYLLEDEYNPKSETMVTKFYLKQKEANKFYQPLTAENFDAQVKLRDDINKKMKTKVMMPNKNFLVLAIEGYPTKEQVAKVRVNMTSDLITEDESKQGKAAADFYLMNSKKIYNENLKVHDQKSYAAEGSRYQIKFIDKDIKKREKEIAVLNKEIENTNKQIAVVNEEIKELSQEEKEGAMIRKQEYEGEIDKKEIQIDEIETDIKRLTSEKERVSSEN